MPRIRTIKPEFWADEKVSPMADHTRFIFLALISVADDCGRLLDNVKAIESWVWPTTDADEFEEHAERIREALATLANAGVIRRGRTSSGQRVIQITNWEKHQRVDHPNVKGALPEIVDSEGVTPIRERLANDSREPREDVASDSRVEYDQRPTNTTNDQRPIASDKPTTGKGRKRAEPLDLSALKAVHERIYGVGSFGPKLVKAMTASWRELLKAHGPERCARVWAYAHRGDSPEAVDRRRFHSAAYVAERFRDFDPGDSWRPAA